MKNPVNIKLLSSQLKKEVDLFICSSSFEDRCFVIPNSISKDSAPKKSLIFYNDNEYKEIIENANKLGFLLNNTELISLNTDNQIQNAIKINDILDQILNEGVDTVLLDTTTFTHETLLVIFRLLNFKKSSFKTLLISYVGAKDYSTDKSELSEKWLSSGISEIRTIMGYPGVMSPARENHLVVLFGFESSRTRNLIEHLQFDRVSLGFGAEGKSIDLKHYELNYERHCKLMDYYNYAHKFDIDLTDPMEAKKNIEDYISSFSDQNIVIAPMNNKISTIGAALAAIDNPRIQLIYAKPVEYNVKGYSQAKEEGYIYEIW